MSTTRGETKQSIKSTVIGGAVAIVVAVGAVFGVSVGLDNARAQAAQLHLLSVAKTSSITMQAATMEDFSVNAGAIQKQAIRHTDMVAALQVAARVAAQKAAAAKAAAAAAAQAAALAAQQAAQQQTQQTVQQSATVQRASAPAAPTSDGLPAGSPVPWIPSSDPNNTAGGSWDTQACASHNASGNPAICT